MGLQRVKSPLSVREEQIATAIVSSTFAVHKELGPGLLENVYAVCLCHNLSKLGFQYQRQAPMRIVYDGVTFDEGYPIDILVESLAICELKSVETMLPVFDAQLLTYMKLAKKRLGFLINFNAPLIKDGIKRFVI